MSKDMVGIVLAGGQSRRFGKDKAFLKRDETYFYKYSLAALKQTASSIVLVTNDTLYKRFLAQRESFPIITDKIEYKALGPLAGIYTGMDYVSSNWYAVAPIDVPFINAKIFLHLRKHQAEEFDAIIPVVSGRIQPLLSLYHNRVQKIVHNQLEKEALSLQQLLELLHVKYVELEDEKAFYNINSTSDYEKWVRPR